MTRADQYDWMRDSVAALLLKAKSLGLHVRGGEWQRPDLLARIYSTGIDLMNRGLKLFSNKVGVQKSDHTQSLALDLWITTDDGKGICWEHFGYALLGDFWESLGGVWGGRFKKVDRYHFEVKGDPL
jgi:hypothetical protein